ncbi:Nodulation protein W [Pararobbsia alpina]|uniref:response regulator transcription factor n=1 Tax=Pararobbsia alpina TaxID=621374 RepID=UPI0039A48441
MPSETTAAARQNNQAVVYVIDDDPSLRFALNTLLRSAGFDVHVFERTAQFIAFEKPDVPSCLVLDVRLHGESGLAFQTEIRAHRLHIPIIFLTAHGDIEMSVRAMKDGAVDFLSKPVKDQRVIDAVVAALAKDTSLRSVRRTQDELRARFETLTRREREVIVQVANSKMNKEIAAALAVSEITVKAHRAAAMRKMGASSLAELVRQMEWLGPVTESTYD